MRKSLTTPPETTAIAEEPVDDNARPDAWLVAIDLDGTTIDETGTASVGVVTQLRRIDEEGHHLLIATGRSAASTLPVLDHLGIRPQYVICSNGGVTLERDDTASSGYHRLHTTAFDVSAVLTTIRAALPEAHLAVETEAGLYRYTHPFPPATTEASEHQLIAPFEDLLDERAVRVVATMREHDVAEFRRAVEGLGLTGVTFTLGWTAWLDIAAEGVTKAVAAERVRKSLGCRRERVLAVGDGFNDIEFLQWAGQFGRGVAMGHAPHDLLAVASEITGAFIDDGLAQVLGTV